MNQTNILLESGNNEIEVFEFIVGNQNFGINALKISELTQMKSLTVTKIPQVHPSFVGTVLFRGSVVPLIDLKSFLQLANETSEVGDRNVVLFCEFNRKTFGFMIDKIVSIHRIRWNDIQPPHKLLGDSMVTAIAVAEKREITILDFESITFNILGDEIFDSVKGQPSTEVQSNLLNKKIYIADDSHVIRKKINLLLEKTGFTDLHFFENGQLIYDAISSKSEKVDLVLSDIEMPVMDGLTMCKTLKSNFPEIPVIIMSSMVNDQISVKCQSVHADASISKGEIDSLPLIIAKVLMK